MDDIPHGISHYIKSVRLHIFEDYLYIDRDSYFALQIFNSPTDHHHRSGIKGSVFDYMNMTGSPLGSKKLKSWFLSPLAKLENIKERHGIMKVLLDQNNSRFFTDLCHLEKNLGNIETILSAISTSKPNVLSWKNLDLYLRTSLEIYNIVSVFNDFHRTVLGQRLLNDVDTKAFKELLIDISALIDFESSEENNRVYIKDGFDPPLDDMRRTYTGLEQVLESLAAVLFQVYHQFPEEALNVAYIPQLGYLISIDISFIQVVPLEWVEVFKTDTTVYFKEDYMTRIDDEYGDIYQLMVDYEIELLHLLQRKIVDDGFIKSLLSASSLFAELDCYLSLASVALLHNFTEPKMVNDPIVFIEEGRHIILEQTVTSFVPNNTLIPERTLSVVTGANSSGKSVYLTHVGIIIFLAHLGSYVPATRATIGITDRLLTRIVTREAIDKCESTFFIDLKKMSKCLTMCTPKSIMLIDEFGKGTDTLGGPSLLGSIIEDLIHQESTPRCIITTHFHDLFKDGILENMDRVRHSHMDIVLSEDGQQGITYLYQLKDGLCDNSFGIECAQVCGIPEKIIKRAREIAVSRKHNQKITMELDQLQLERAKYATRDFLMWDVDSETPIDEIKGKLGEILDIAAGKIVSS